MGQNGGLHDPRCDGACGPCGGAGGINGMNCLSCHGTGQCRGCAGGEPVCPTCGEWPWSIDAGPCDGDHECARRLRDERAAQDEADYLAGLEREARLRES